MFEGQFVSAKSASYSLYSPWMGRGGNGLRATLDLIENESGCEIMVEVYTKDSEDSGAGSNADSGGTVFIKRNSAGRSTVEWLGTTSGAVQLKEMVRYKFTVTDGTGWALFRMLAPVWFDDVDA